MSNSFISSLNVATDRIYLSMGITLLIGGIIGGLLNIIVFQSLKIYRKSSSAFYLTIVSIVNIGQLLTGLLSRVVNSLSAENWSETSLILCRLRYYCFHTCAVLSPTCLCLVTIDQFLVTSIRPQWQQWSNIKNAHRLSLFSIIFWLLYGIPYTLYYTPNVSITTGITTCLINNPDYIKYYNDIHLPVFMFTLPFLITIIFGFLSYYNTKQLYYQTVPLVRRRHEAQLTIMIFVQIIFNIFATTPSLILRIIILHSTIDSDPTIAAQLRVVTSVLSSIYFSYYAIPFYIYICTSERFRKQLRYVILDIHLIRWRRVPRNQVLPIGQLLAPKTEIQPVIVKNIELV